MSFSPGLADSPRGRVTREADEQSVDPFGPRLPGRIQVIVARSFNSDQNGRFGSQEHAGGTFPVALKTPIPS